MAGVELKVRWKPVLQSAEMESAVGQVGEQLRAKADSVSPSGASYGLAVERRRGFPHAYVYTKDLHAMRSNAKHNTLGMVLGK